MTSVPTTAATSVPRSRAGRTDAPTRVRPRWRHQYAVVLVLLDVVAAAVAAGATLKLQFADANGSPGPYLLGMVAFPLLYVVVAATGRSYEARYLADGTDEFHRILTASVWLAAVVSGAAFGLGLTIPRGYVVLALPLALAGSLVGRSVSRRLLRTARRRGSCQHRVLLVGTERSIAEMVRQMAREPGAGYTVVGACLDRSTGASIEGIPVVGSSATIVNALWETKADTIAVTAWSILSQRQLRKLSWQLEDSDVDVLVAPAITDIAGPRIS
ncbi:MAG: hypothetical protein ABJC62_04975, partial [Frankiaceae bacterium]